MTNDVTSKTVETPPNVSAAPNVPTTNAGQPTAGNTPATKQTTQETLGYSTSENMAYDMGAQSGSQQQGANAQSDAVNNINHENRSGMADSAQTERKAEASAGGSVTQTGRHPGGTSE